MTTALENFVAAIEETALRMRGCHIADIRQIRQRDLLFVLAETKEWGFAVSLDPAHPVMALVPLTFDWQQLPKATNPILRIHLLKAKIDEVVVTGSDYVVTLIGHRKTDLYIIETWSLVAELFKKHPNLVLTVSDKIVYVHKTFGLEQARPLLPGFHYAAPTPTLHERDYVKEMDTYISSLWDSVLREQAQPLLRKLTVRKKQLEKKIGALEGDLAAWHDALGERETADAIVGHERRLEHLTELAVDGKVLALDPAFTVADNARRMYRRYRKARLARQPLEDQLAKARSELDAIGALLGREAPRSMFEIEDLTEAMTGLGLILPPKIDKAKENQKAMPYYVIVAGIRYSFGRQASQNDVLTFGIAQPTDWFFHINNYPGAHVVCHAETLSASMIETAASIAILLSRRSEGEVSYAIVKTIKRGAKPGLVYLREAKTVFIREADRTLISLLAAAKRHQR